VLDDSIGWRLLAQKGFFNLRFLTGLLDVPVEESQPLVA
jgi:hypothetical protein